ncbi:phage tail protein [Azospirillum thermophilum]|uniref:Phage tail protein n=1 Tax=Azospirillum thermophilum TaxID=2202148 RepID=A0A2S2CZE6_9PROT|nr:phage tail protein [Azospirillum thermophilum]AWK89882.1 phage tail protein [Azospirillum thermophilum]
MGVDVYCPPPGFSFSVSVAGSGASLQSASAVDGSFQEVSGLDATVETETVTEGGENRFVHRLPGVTRYPNLVLRRGYVTQPSFLSEWAAQTVGSTLNQAILTQTLVVMLLGADRAPLVAWNVAQAWPVRWVTGPFDSMKNEYLTEVLEFSYAYVTRMPKNEAASMVGRVSSLIGGR